MEMGRRVPHMILGEILISVDDETDDKYSRVLMNGW